MKIDHLAVDRLTTAEPTGKRQGSQQVEQVKQVEKAGQGPAKASVEQHVEVKAKEKEAQRVRETESDMKALQEAVDQANKSFKAMNRRFEYNVHETLSRVFVKVIDSSTDELIREIPSEKLLDMVANMLEVAGIIMDERG